MKQFQVVRDFEAELCSYTGARYAVTTNSCTMALLLACAWHKTQSGPQTVTIPAETYVSVPQSIIHAGHRVAFEYLIWEGEYQLMPLPVWDSARRFRAGMFRVGQMQCLSFHASKILGTSQGGAILHDNDEADAWFRRARFDGRTEGVPANEDYFDMIGWHCYMNADTAAQLLCKLTAAEFSRDNPDLPTPVYADLSKSPVFA